jgi:hypothetical protein
MPRSRRMLLLVVAATALLAGCGQQHRVAEAPQDVARHYVATNAPAKCGLLTPELLEQTTQRRGAAARAACERNVQRLATPGRVTVKEFELRHRGAEVELLTDDEEARVMLVKRSGHWLISGFEAG